MLRTGRLLLAIGACLVSIPLDAYLNRFLVHDRLKGAIMGSALADAFGRVILQRRQEKREDCSLAAFDQFDERDWVYSPEKYYSFQTGLAEVAVYNEHTLLAKSVLDSCIESRKQRESKEFFAQMMIDSIIHSPLMVGDPYAERRFFSKRWQEISMCLKNAFETKVYVRPDSGLFAEEIAGESDASILDAHGLLVSCILMRSINYKFIQTI